MIRPKIESLAPVVADLVTIRAQQSELLARERALLETLRDNVTPADVPAFREQYGSLVVPSVVTPRGIPHLPVSEWITHAEHLDSWPLRGSVVPGMPTIHVRDLIDIVGTQRARVDVPFTPIITIKSRQTREDALRLLIAAPTPTVAAAMRDAGDARFAHVGETRIDFRNPPSKGGEDAD